MKSRIAVAVAVALVCLGHAATARAQVFELISSFAGCTPEGCPDGGDPGLPAGPLLPGPDGSFYGALAPDGRIGDVPWYRWAIYRLDAAGNRVILYRFTGEGTTGCFNGSMTVGADGAVYGLAFGCDIAGQTIFRLDGTSFQVVYEFPPDFYPGSLHAGPGGAFYGAATDGVARLIYQWDGTLRVLYSVPIDHLFDAGFHDFVRTPDGNLFVVLARSHFLVGPFDGAVFRISAGGRIDLIHQFSFGQRPASLLLGNDGNLYGYITAPAPGGEFQPRLYRMTLSGVVTYLAASARGRPVGAGPDGSVFFVPAVFSVPSPEDLDEIFRLTPSGEVVPIHTFDGTNRGGELPRLTPGFDGHLYGVRSQGGAHDLGVFYRIRMPAADIKANASDGPITIGAGNPLEISLAFDAAPTTTIDPSEVYVAVVTPTLQVYWMTASGFSATPARLYAGPLAAFGSVPLLTIPDAGVLPAGDYYWVTIVDSDANGVPNGTWVDVVKTTRVGGGP